MLHMRAKKANDGFALTAFPQAEKQINRMTEMINGFLNVSRLESGTLHLQFSNFDINELIREVVDEIKLSHSTHKFSFSSSDVLSVTADKDKVCHVLLNLITNAVKYSPEGVAIEISSQKNSTNAVIAVKDSGIGINDRDLEKLFTRYYRVEEVNTKYISGFGIGLYLCAEIIQLHKGNIWAESELRKGSTFTFTLPLDVE
jgi:signal transduction histidine kinase